MISRLLFFLLLAGRLAAQDVAVLLGQGAKLEAAFREEEALRVYQRVLELQPNSVAALCHCSDLSCRIGNREEDREGKLAYFREGSRYARTAYGLDSTNSEVNVVMAFSLGRMTLIQSGRERVAAAWEIRRYATQAIRYDPRNYKAWHIMGRWQYELSSLSGLERTLARWFFGVLPEASLNESVDDYAKSMALRPEFLLNYYELARAYRREGRKGEAIAMLIRMDELPDGMFDDRTVRIQGKRLLAELR